MSVQPGVYDVTIYQGDVWTEAFQLQTWTNYPSTPKTYEPEDLTGKTVRFQIRKNNKSSVVLLSGSTGDGRISVPDPTSGWIYISVPGDITADLDFDCAIWDIEYYSDVDNPSTFLKGDVKLDFETTR